MPVATDPHSRRHQDCRNRRQLQPLLHLGLAALLCPLPIRAETSPPIASASLRTELEAMAATDQRHRPRLHELMVRGQIDTAEFRALAHRQQQIDAANIARLNPWLEAAGWPRREQVGAAAVHAAFMVIQHAEPEQQKHWLPLMRAAADAGELSAAELALLEDRILVRDGLPQRYGSQLSVDPASGRLRFEPIADEATLDARRAAVGLEPMADYARRFGLIYAPSPR